jgi:hypothetical protein
MKTILLSTVILAVFLAGGAAQDFQGFTAEELAAGIRTSGRIRQIFEGDVLDELRVSRDGKWIAVTRFTEDIKNNEIWLLASDGSRREKIEAPYGYKNTPALLGGYEENGVRKPLSIFVSIAERAGSPAGIYRAEIFSGTPDWKLWEKGNFRDLSLNGSEEYLMASTGRWNSRIVRSHVILWPLDPAGGKTGKSHIVAPELKGQVHKIVMTPDKKEIIFSCVVDHPGEHYGLSNIYRAANTKNAPASLMFPRADNPAIRETLFGYVLFYKSGDETIGRFNSSEKQARRIISLTDIHPNGLECDPRTNRLFLGVQRGIDRAGLLSIEDQ